MAAATQPSRRDATWWPKNRKMYLVTLSQASLMLILLFLGIMSWFFGTAYHQRYRVHALKVLVVDFDGGAVGSAVSGAYNAFASSEFPTFEFASAEKYPDPASIRRAVCKHNYWGAVYTHSGATDRLTSAVAGSLNGPYNASDTVSYVYTETRYPATSLSYVKANLETLIAASRNFFYQTPVGQSSLATINATNPAAVAAYLNPIEASEVNLKPMEQGVRMYINTVNMVMPILSQFFFILAMNGISAEFGLFTNMPSSRVWLIRLVAGKIYSLLLALAISGYTWAYREDWSVHSLEFGRTWMILWFYMDTNNAFFDSLIGSYVPMPFSPFLVLSWILTNIASTVFPFELSAGFFRIGYAFPSHETYALLIQAWTGCFKKDYIALPVMFSWWVVGHVGAYFSARKRCADAIRMAQAAEDRVAEMISEKESASNVPGDGQSGYHAVSEDDMTISAGGVLNGQTDDEGNFSSMENTKKENV